MKSRVSEFFLAGITAAAVSVFVLSAQAPAIAKSGDGGSNDNGVAGSLHTLVRAGRTICMKDHYHYGDSEDQATKKMAREGAVYAWSSFTALEYGDVWGSYRIARARKIQCSKSMENSKWSCSVEALPCMKKRRFRSAGR